MTLDERAGRHIQSPVQSLRVIQRERQFDGLAIIVTNRTLRRRIDFRAGPATGVFPNRGPKCRYKV